MHSLTDETIQNAIEAASTEGALPSIIQTHSSCETPVPTGTADEKIEGTAEDIIDDKHAPPIFNNVLQEFVSILTLAVAPGLNVISSSK